MKSEDLARHVLQNGKVPALSANTLKQWKAENHVEICPVFGEKIIRLHADHDHQDGRMRGSLQAEANILIGKIENFEKRMAKFNTWTTSEKLRAVADYLEVKRPFLLHPSHRRIIRGRFRREKLEKQLEILAMLGIDTEPLTNGVQRAKAFMEATTELKK